MVEVSKKSREREIVQLVYGFRPPFDVTGSEQPDFVVKLYPSDKPFGIEVTEFFHSQASARLDRIPGYTADLLAGAPFRHKVDRKELEVGKIQIMSGGTVRH